MFCALCWHECGVCEHAYPPRYRACLLVGTSLRRFNFNSFSARCPTVLKWLYYHSLCCSRSAVLVLAHACGCLDQPSKSARLTLSARHIPTALPWDSKKRLVCVDQKLQPQCQRYCPCTGRENHEPLPTNLRCDGLTSISLLFAFGCVGIPAFPLTPHAMALLTWTSSVIAVLMMFSATSCVAMTAGAGACPIGMARVSSATDGSHTRARTVGPAGMEDAAPVVDVCMDIYESAVDVADQGRWPFNKPVDAVDPSRLRVRVCMTRVCVSLR